MARELKPRQSYLQDAAFLLKLAGAIEKDEEVTSDKRREVVQRVQELSNLLSSLKVVNGKGRGK
jgi:hypothetical protein